jgi:uncharacterized protein (UPF0332 family)
VTVTEFLRKAHAALASAKRDLAAGDLDGTANRLYYAMFHAARAALLSIGRLGPLAAELRRAIAEIDD